MHERKLNSKFLYQYWKISIIYFHEIEIEFKKENMSKVISIVGNKLRKSFKATCY